MAMSSRVRCRGWRLAAVGVLCIGASALVSLHAQQRTPPRTESQKLNEELDHWRAFVAAYRRGGLPAVRGDVGQWPVSRVRRVTQWIRIRNDDAAAAATDAVVEAADLEAAAVLHLDLAVAEVDQGVYRDAPDHISAGPLFLSLRDRVGPSGVGRSFKASWSQVAAALLLAAMDLEGFEAHLPQFEAAAPDDPHLWMIRGAYAELRCSPVLEYPLARRTGTATPGGRPITAAQRATLVADAERAYRTSVRIEPRLVEGWLRLALLLSRHGRPEEARVAAQYAQAETKDPVFQYLGLLVSAGASEDVGEWQAAENAYRSALGIEPDSQAAVVGLSEVLLRGGRRREAAAVLLGRIARPGGRTPPDPWWEFQGGPYWRVSTVLDELRRRIRL